MAVISLPKETWEKWIVKAVETAPFNSTINVWTEDQKRVGERIANFDRLNRPDIKFVVI